jgi:CTP synthase
LQNGKHSSSYSIQKSKTISVAIIAKYIATGDYELKDSYVSLIESLNFAGWHNDTEVKILFVNAEQLEKSQKSAVDALEKADGIIVPIGWGERGVEGKIRAIKYAREKKVPYLGLCYGMQLASVEYARNVCGLKDAHTTEVNPNTEFPIIHDTLKKNISASKAMGPVCDWVLMIVS